jgi:hypothetical protein
MKPPNETKVDFNPLLADWIKSVGRLWEAPLKQFASQTQPSTADSAAGTQKKGRTQESWDFSLKMLQAMMSAMGDPHLAESFVKSAGTWPELFFKMAKSGWENFARLQEQWIAKAGKAGQTTESYSFENLDEDLFRIWSETYAKDFQPFFKMPQLGLFRFYQERMTTAADKFNIFMIAMGEFLQLFTLPLDKSLKVLQSELTKMAEEGNLPENSKDYYNMWIKILEGHYMTLYKSPEYTQAMGNAIDTLDEFLAIRKNLLEDILKTFPIPTQADMDDLYEEMYLLKKRIKALEQK